MFGIPPGRSTNDGHNRIAIRRRTGILFAARMQSVCDFHEIDMLITDQAPADPTLRRLEEEGVTVCVGS